jgi:hypothetical protein
MTDRLYLDRSDVYLLADYDAGNGGRVRLVVCQHPAGAEYAAQLAARLRVPLHYGPEPDDHAAPDPPPSHQPGPTIAA